MVHINYIQETLRYCGVLMLAHRFPRQPNFKSTMGQRLSPSAKYINSHNFSSVPKKWDMLAQCWVNASPPSTTLAQHQPSIGQHVLFAVSVHKSTIAQLVVTSHLLISKSSHSFYRLYIEPQAELSDITSVYH